LLLVAESLSFPPAGLPILGQHNRITFFKRRRFKGLLQNK